MKFWKRLSIYEKDSIVKMNVMRKMKLTRKFGNRLFRLRQFSTQVAHVNAEKAYQLARKVVDSATGNVRNVRVRVTPTSMKIYGQLSKGWNLWVDDIVQPK